MMFLWELLIQAKQEKVATQEIKFQYPKRYSPYLELNFEDLNTLSVQKDVEINPYYRFSEIFNRMFSPDEVDDTELKKVLFDLFIHYIGTIDTNRGMTRCEYQIGFVKDDIAKGLFGKEVKSNFPLFSEENQYYLANSLLRLYQTNEGVLIFREAIKAIYPKAIIFVNVSGKDEMTVFLQIKETTSEQKKIEVLKQLFLPFKFKMRVFYEYMFGIIGEETLMKIEQMIID